MSDVRIETINHVMVITLDRARKKNALTNSMYGDIATGLTAAKQDAEVHVVLLTAEGPDFCAGNDINALLDAQGDKRLLASTAELFLTALSTFPKPLIAAVTGKAIGIGATLLLHCDLIYVAADAQLTLPFIDLGLVPEAGSARLLPAIVGHPRAFSMFAFGRPLSGSAAADFGLVSTVLPREDVFSAAMEDAKVLAQKSLSALVATKALMRDATAIRAALAADRQALLERLSSPEAASALADFVTRKPESKSPQPKS